MTYSLGPLGYQISSGSVMHGGFFRPQYYDPRLFSFSRALAAYFSLFCR